MEIKTIFIWVCFTFCLGLTAGGVLVLFKNKKYRKLSSFQQLQYYLILVYAFGYYSVWSKIFFQLVYGSTIAIDRSTDISDFLIILGIPFLVSGKVLFVFWSINLLKKKPGTLLLAAAFTIIFLLVLIYASYIRFNILSNIRQLYAVFVISVSIFISTTFLFSETEYLTGKQKLKIVLLITFSGLAYISLFFTKLNQSVSELIFIFLFFLTNTTIAVYFTYSVKLPLDTAEPITPVSLDSFIEKYQITAREEEIIQLIHQGKTNKEIADILFVTVQTIKDHTHRIYQKTDVKSRAQLTLLVRTFFK